ncbi:homeobox-DDT domain protein RLT3-like [Zingiber officinale]|uniref:Homeobox-DDT domain protein RLT3 n=1 Tax=Zingiber officinale TaxID=94328 RepID=A0A8J5KM81_ZINOF|nr:homeobox-DDT domain protein RLT3-like [Zingiber officinale]KAG6482178.1 hypothetical protein ZIOFF_058809 [Zingiber officinale]
MDIDGADAHKDNGTKKKTAVQLQSLETFYAEEKYPKQNKVEEYASTLDLTHKQVRIWFAERRRKERRVFGASNASIRSFLNAGCRGMAGTTPRHANKSKIVTQKGRYKTLEQLEGSHLDERKDHAEKKYFADLQTLFSKDYILKKIYRKDGPALGKEFDPPGNVFGHCTDLYKLQYSHSHGNRRMPKRSKSLVSSMLTSKASNESNPFATKYGMGKGLMTVWRATQPNGQKLPDGGNCTASGNWMNLRSNDSHKTTFSFVSRQPQQRRSCMRHSYQKKSQDKRNQVRKVASQNVVNAKETHLKGCKLSLDESSEQPSELMALIDDEELELEELQVGPNPLRCTAHLASNGRHGCPLCKDLLARFPPQIVKMKQLFQIRPWDSSPGLVKKLFKVLQFICGQSGITELCPFTIDEFAQAFHDKDSLLLGKIHVALIKLLMLDAEKEINSGSLPRASNVCRFLVFLNFMREEGFDIKHWTQYLNSLTWVEILRQVLIAAGFGSRQNMARRANYSKERNQMEKYGLSERTLKGELFSLLSKQGSVGLKISDMARTSQIVDLGLSHTTEEVEQLVYSTLSSDITLFEKISPSAFRLRVDPHIKGRIDSESDTDDSGSVDDESDKVSTSCSSDDSEVDLAIRDRLIVKYKTRHKKSSRKLAEYTEIDESYSGEAWMQGLMEGEYSNLTIEEKLDALVALVDLVGACPSVRMEEHVRTSTLVTGIRYHGSGAKIKRKMCSRQSVTMLEADTPLCSMSLNITTADNVDTSINRRGCQLSSSGSNSSKVKEACNNMHPMQSILLGSDRRYNNYWLFLGLCSVHEPGHRRVYFESSEDGHWEVIDTAQALQALLSILDRRGIREARLLASLEKRKSSLYQAMNEYTVASVGSRQINILPELDATSTDGSSPTSDVDHVLLPAESNGLSVGSGAIDLEIGKTNDEKKQKCDRLRLYDKWVWDSFYSTLNATRYGKRSYMESLIHCESCNDLFWRDEKHCKICHTTFEIDFDLEERYAIHRATCREPDDVGDFPLHKVLPSQLQVLKASIHAIEVSMPEAALASTWRASTQKLWVKRLQRASSLPELLQVLTDFVSAMVEEWLCECATASSPNVDVDDLLVHFQTMPQTISAVALWIVKLDALIAPRLEVIYAERSKALVSQPKRRRTCTNR